MRTSSLTNTATTAISEVSEDWTQLLTEASTRARHWNFPAGHAGRIFLTLRIPYGSQGANICLCAHWFNPVDPTVAVSAQFVLNIDAGANLNRLLTLPYDKWFNLEIKWIDSRSKGGNFRFDSGDWFELPLCNPSVTGISYLHIKSAAEGADPFGTWYGKWKPTFNKHCE